MTMTNVDVALLQSEWSCGEEWCCAVCGAEADYGYTGDPLDPSSPTGYTGAHNAGCEMDLALAERGFPTQIERNEARAQLKART